MPANDPKVMTIVAEALKRTDPAARATYLDSVCGDDADFRRRSKRCSPLTTRPDDPWKQTPRGCTNRPHPKLSTRPRHPTRQRFRHPHWRPGNFDPTARTSHWRSPRAAAGPADPEWARSSPAGTRCSKSSARGAWAPFIGQAKPHQSNARSRSS